MGIFKPPYPAFLRKDHPLAQGLVGLWLFNEKMGSTVHDISGYGSHGTLTNMDPDTDWVGGKFGPALDFEGTLSNYILVPRSPSLEPTNGVTVSMWIKRNGAQTTWASLIHKPVNDGGSAPYVQYDFQFYSISDDTLRFGTGHTDNAQIVVYSPGTVPDGEWVFLAGTYSKEETYSRFYLGKDGNVTYNEVSNTHGDLKVDTTDDLYIATFKENTSLYRYFNGCIDDICIYDRALSREEIAWLYSQPFDFAQPRKKYWFQTAAPPWGLSIPVAMHHYRQQKAA